MSPVFGSVTKREALIGPKVLQSKEVKVKAKPVTGGCHEQILEC